MSVRCKFKVDSITKYANKETVYVDGKPVKNDDGSWKLEVKNKATIKMSPVYANSDPNHENSKFWAATPSGSFEFGTVNEAAVEQLTLGDEYYIDITPAK